MTQCDECGSGESGWQHLVAELAAVAAVVAVAAWVYGQDWMRDMMREELRVDPLGARVSLSAMAGLVAGVPVHFVGWGMAERIRKNRLGLAAVRQRLRKRGRRNTGCRWCGCANGDGERKGERLQHAGGSAAVQDTGAGGP